MNPEDSQIRLFASLYFHSVWSLLASLGSGDHQHWEFFVKIKETACLVLDCASQLQLRLILSSLAQSPTAFLIQVMRQIGVLGERHSWLMKLHGG